MIRLDEFLNSINEEFFDSFKLKGDIVELFVNPTKYEFKEVFKVKPEFRGTPAGKTFARIKNSIRFVADAKKKKLIIWNSEFLHYEVLKKIGYDLETVPTNPAMIAGLAQPKGDGWEIDFTDDATFYGDDVEDSKEVADKYAKDFAKVDWKWLDKYFLNGSELIKHILEVIKDYR